MSGLNISCQVLSGGQSAKISTSTTSAQSAVLTSTSYLVYTDVDVFVRTGADPTAVSDGTDQILPAKTQSRIVPILLGNKLAFITPTGTGNVYLTPDA